MLSAATSDRACVVDLDEARVDRIFERFDQCRLPGAAVGISVEGRPVYRKAFGLANMELPVTLSTSIRMRIGSISKHFTSLAYMLLCEEGRAKVDDPIGKYLPELHPVIHSITIRQLMGHTGGLRDAIDICLQLNGPGKEITAPELLELYRNIEDVSAAPGTTWNYNNGGYLILSAVIEKISGRPLGQVLQEKIFVPAGMYDTLLRPFDSNFAPNSAAAHMTTGAGGFVKDSYGTDFAGGGGVVSSVDDMLRWMAQIDRPTIGRAATWSQMTTPQVLANGSSTGYGLGLVNGRYRGISTLWHSGGWMGGNAQMLKVPRAGLDVIVIVNRQDALGIDLAYQVLDACLPELEPSRAAGTAQVVSGTFLSEATGSVFRLFGESGKQIVSINGLDIPFVSALDGVFRPVPRWSHLKKTITPVGILESPRAIILDDFGNVEELVRVDLRPDADVGGIAGVYRCDSLGAEARIESSPHGPALVTTGRFGSVRYVLRPVSGRLWEVTTNSTEHWGGVLVVSADRRSIALSTWNTHALRFRRANGH